MADKDNEKDTGNENVVVFTPEALEEPLKSYAQQVLTSSASPTSKYDTLEIQLRRHLLSSEELSKDWNTCWNLCLYILTHSDLNVRKLPFVLLEDLVETLPIEKLQHFWSTCVHVQTERLCSGVMWDTSSGNSHVLQWIRLQNALLRRLPNAKGDVLMTMAKILPLSDRSAMKQWGSVAGTGTGTPIDYEDDEEYKQDMMETDETALPFAFYQVFWGLQHDMANPYSISFAKFFQSSKMVMAAMESKPLHTDDTKNTSFSQVASTQKYLTGGRLLPLQLQDPTFRQCWLTQFCIVVSFMSSQSTSLKTTLIDLANRAKQLLAALPNNGELFVKRFEWILEEREKMWRAWKKNKCKPDIKPPPSLLLVQNNDQNVEEMAKTTKSARILLEKNSTPPSQHLLQLEDLTREKAKAIPNLYHHLEEYVDALDPDAGIEAEYHPKQNNNFCWQTLRLLAREHLDCFGDIRHSDGDFERMVRHIYKKRGMDIPGQSPPQDKERDHDAELEEENVKGKDEPADDDDAPPVTHVETSPMHVAMEEEEEEEKEKESAPEEADREQQVEDTVEENIPEPEKEDGPSPKSKEEDDVPREEEDEAFKGDEAIVPVETSAGEDKAPDDDIKTEVNAEQKSVDEGALDDAAKMETHQSQVKEESSTPLIAFEKMATEEEPLSSAEGEEMKQTKDKPSEPLTAFEKMAAEKEALSLAEGGEMKQTRDKSSDSLTAFEKMAMEEEALLLAEGEEMKEKVQERAVTESKQEPTKPKNPMPKDAKPKQDPARGASQKGSMSDDRKRKRSSPVMNESSTKRLRENPQNDNRGRRDDDSRRGGWGPGGRGPPPPHRELSHREGGRRGDGGRGDGQGMRRGGPPPPRGGRGDDGRRAPRGRDTRRRY